MIETIFIQNLKCGGCAHTISSNLKSIENISDVLVDLETNKVNFKYKQKNDIKAVKKKLKSLGYPSIDETNNIAIKAKSFVNCAVGKISK